MGEIAIGLLGCFLWSVASDRYTGKVKAFFCYAGSVFCFSLMVLVAICDVYGQ